MKNVLAIHDGDPNFPHVTLQNIKAFMGTWPPSYIDIATRTYMYSK